MDFDIQARKFQDGRLISLPSDLRQDLRLIVGQCIQLQTRDDQVILQVVDPWESGQKFALVSEDIYEQIKDKELEYNTVDITLGCDPEFFIMWGQRKISAAVYLPFAGQIGSDGELGEIRPAYGRHEDEVVANISKLIPQIPAKMKRNGWTKTLPSGGNKFSYEAHSYHKNTAAGFHVHLGLPPEILNTQKDFNRVTMNHLVQCLDWYLSVPLMSLEKNHSRRMGRSNYGKPGDYRPSNITLEYRTPGAYFLRSPELTTSLLGTALALMEVIVKRVKETSGDFINLHKLTKTDLNDLLPVPDKDYLRKILTHRDVQVAHKEIPKIKNQLEGLPNYQDHKKAIDGLFSIEGRDLQVGPDLLTNWKEKL